VKTLRIKKESSYSLFTKNNSNSGRNLKSFIFKVNRGMPLEIAVAAIKASGKVRL
jgi:hypothetical protein